MNNENLEINDIVIFNNTKVKIIDKNENERQVEFEDGGTLWVDIDNLSYNEKKYEN